MSKPGNTPQVRLDDSGIDVHWRVEADRRPGREGQVTTRYVGQPRRGQISFAQQDDRDMAFAIRELVEAREMLRVAYQVADKRDRREAVATALARAALGTRMADQLIAKRTGSASDCTDEES